MKIDNVKTILDKRFPREMREAWRLKDYNDVTQNVDVALEIKDEALQKWAELELRREAYARFPERPSTEKKYTASFAALEYTLYQGLTDGRAGSDLDLGMLYALDGSLKASLKNVRGARNSYCLALGVFGRTQEQWGDVHTRASKVIKNTCAEKIGQLETILGEQYSFDQNWSKVHDRWHAVYEANKGPASAKAHQLAAE